MQEWNFPLLQPQNKQEGLQSSMSEIRIRKTNRIPALLSQVRSRYQLLLLMTPALIYLFIFAYYPMFGVQIAFKDFNPVEGIWGSPWVGFEHFKTFFSSYYFKRVVTNTLRISFYSIAAQFPLTIMFALMLNVMRHQRLKKFIQTITYVPHFISVVVLVGIIYQLLNPVTGMYGNVYRAFFSDMYPSDILGKSGTFIHLYVWSAIWQQLGWGAIIYIAALSSVNPELHEAAMIDGANRFSRVLHIDIPAILPTASIMLILRMGAIMNVGFEKAYLMQNNLNLVSSEIISTYVYKVAMTSGGGNFSYASAIGLFNSIINCTLLVLVNTLSRKLNENGSSLW